MCCIRPQQSVIADCECWPLARDQRGSCSFPELPLLLVEAIVQVAAAHKPNRALEEAIKPLNPIPQ